MEFKVLDAKTIRQLVGIEDVVAAVEDVFKAYGRGDVRMPSKIYLDVSGGDFRAMPASVPGLAGVKWVNVHPGNATLGLPTVMATILINDPKTGRPLGLLDGTWITQARTGAAAAVATKHLARPDRDRRHDRTAAAIGNDAARDRLGQKIKNFTSPTGTTTARAQADRFKTRHAQVDRSWPRRRRRQPATPSRAPIVMPTGSTRHAHQRDGRRCVARRNRPRADQVPRVFVDD